MNNEEKICYWLKKSEYEEGETERLKNDVLTLLCILLAYFYD